MQLGAKLAKIGTSPVRRGEFLGCLFPEGIFKSLTPDFFTITGEGPSQWLNQPLTSFVHTGCQSSVEEAFQSLYEGNTVSLPYLCCQLHSGQLVFLDLTLIPSEIGRTINEILVFGEKSHGETTSSKLPCYSEIHSSGGTERLVWRGPDFETLLLSFFEQVLANAPLGFGFFSRALRFTCINESLADMYGYTPDQYLGKSLEELLPDVAEKIRNPLQQVLKEGKPVTDIQVDLIRGDKKTHTLHSFYPVHSDSGVIGVGCLVVDLSSRIEIENKLSGTALELSRSNDDLQRFAYAASHDLKEPLRMISTYIQLLELSHQGEVDEKSNLYMKFILDGVGRMRALIDDLLHYSSVSAKREPHTFQSSETLLKEAVANLHPYMAETKAVLTCGPLPSISCDPIKTVQVFQNLLENALKYRSARPPEIRVEAHLVDAMWVFSVQDNGIGFDMKFSQIIFELFQRLHTRQAYPGTGIGLATCKRIVELSGGQIWAESTPGKGSTFYFSVPSTH